MNVLSQIGSPQLALRTILQLLLDNYSPGVFVLSAHHSGRVELIAGSHRVPLDLVRTCVVQVERPQDLDPAHLRITIRQGVSLWGYERQPLGPCADHILMLIVAGCQVREDLHSFEFLQPRIIRICAHREDADRPLLQLKLFDLPHN
eukprot:6465790-Prymnesium_polylepis.2